jgi:hypothetical protein
VGKATVGKSVGNGYDATRSVRSRRTKPRFDASTAEAGTREKLLRGGDGWQTALGNRLLD